MELYLNVPNGFGHTVNHINQLSQMNLENLNQLTYQKTQNFSSAALTGFVTHSIQPLSSQGSNIRSNNTLLKMLEQSLDQEIMDRKRYYQTEKHVSLTIDPQQSFSSADLFEGISQNPILPCSITKSNMFSSQNIQSFRKTVEVNVSTCNQKSNLNPQTTDFSFNCIQLNNKIAISKQSTDLGLWADQNQYQYQVDQAQVFDEDGTDSFTQSDFFEFQGQVVLDSKQIVGRDLPIQQQNILTQESLNDQTQNQYSHLNQQKASVDAIDKSQKSKYCKRMPKEDKIVEKRAIFRALKYIIQTNYQNFNNHINQKINEQPQQAKLQVLEFMDTMKNGSSHIKQNLKKKQTKNEKVQSQNKQFSKLIGNVCYRFTRKSKEKFFKNKIGSMVFLEAMPYLQNYIQTATNVLQRNKQQHIDILGDFEQFARDEQKDKISSLNKRKRQTINSDERSTSNLNKFKKLY